MDRAPLDPRPEDLLAHAPWVRRLARALVRDEHLAEDVSQDVLAAALDRPPRGLADARRLRAWLAGVTRRRAARATGREAARPAVEGRAAQPEAGGDGPHAALERLATHRRLVEAVMSLEPLQREAVTLRYFDDLAPAEVALRLGVSPDAARQRVHRAVVALRARLNAEDESHGERGAWCAVVSGLLAERGGGAPGALVEATGNVGAPLMGMKKVAAAASLVALGGWGAVWVGRGLVAHSPDAREPGGAAVAPMATPSAADPEVALREGAPSGEARQPSRSTVADNVVASVLVESDDGAPLDAARVVWMRGAELYEVAVDAAGLARPNARDFDVAALDAWRAGPRFAAAVGRVPVEVSGERATLRRLLEFDARLVVDGVAPGTRDLRSLSWSADRDTTESWPPAVRAALGPSGPPEVFVGPDGTFHVGGLRPDESGALVLPGTHVWAAEQAFGRTSDWDERRLDVAPGDVAAGGERVVRARALATVTGAVAWPDGAPAADTSVELRVRLAGASSEARAHATTDAEGRFRAGVSPVAEGEETALSRRPVLPVAGVELRVHGVTGAEPLTAERTFDPPVLSADVGTSMLVPARRVALHVVDGDGAPVPGALAATARGQGDGAGPWKLFGRASRGGELELRPDADHDLVAVGAEGFAVTVVPLAPDPDGAQTVALSSAPRLDLRVVVDGGPPPADLAPRIEHGPVVWSGAAPGGRPTAVHRTLARASGSGTTAAGGWFELEPLLGRGGRWSVGGLAPGVPLRVVVRGRHGDELAARDVAPLAPGEAREIVVEVASPTFTVRGRVVDAAGEPVPQARVTLRRSSGDSYGTRTSAVGEWRVGGYSTDGERVAVRVERDGFVPLELEDVVLRRGGAPLELVVEPGDAFVVRVERADGSPAEGLVVRATTEAGVELRALRAEDGVTHRFVAVPPGPFVVWTHHGGRRFTAEARGADGEATIALPPHGTVRVELDPALARTGERGFLQVALEALDGEPTTAQHSFPAPREGRRPMAPVQELLPGRYRVVATYRPRGAPMDGSADEALGATEVTVVAGAEVTARVGS